MILSHLPEMMAEDRLTKALTDHLKKDLQKNNLLPPSLPEKIWVCRKVLDLPVPVKSLMFLPPSPSLPEKIWVYHKDLVLPVPVNMHKCKTI
tara:strand:+ start:344 stop:619 length:276 start_codon:yes stop_codon:yes gene_type:complete